MTSGPGRSTPSHTSPARNRLSDSLTILHITAPAEVGGLESVVRMLASGHARMGHRVHVAGVIEPQAGNHPFLEAVAAEGVPTTAIQIPARAYLRERAAVRELCERLRPDVVHTHGYRADVGDAGIARRAGCATVTTVHGFTGGDAKNRLYEWLQVEAFKRFDAVVSVSSAITERLAARGVDPGLIRTIPNAFDPDRPRLARDAARRELGLAPDAGFVVGWVGRLSHEKGADVLLDALALVPGEGAPARAVIVGDGPEREALVERARLLGIAERVHWLGTIPDAARVFTGFDVFALSSRTEGIPIVLLEAMAARVPVVAARVGGVPDVVSGREALLVSAEDPGGLAAALAAVRDEPSAALERAADARERLEREFSIAPWLARYEALYREVIGPLGERRA
ncbi:MAG TPA: glycosyltransferase [Gemmatimonadaceae bacterium]